MMRCMICDKALSMTEGRYNPDTGKMGDTCGVCTEVVYDVLLEMSDIDMLQGEVELDTTPMFLDDPEIQEDYDD